MSAIKKTTIELSACLDWIFHVKKQSLQLHVLRNAIS